MFKVYLNEKEEEEEIYLIIETSAKLPTNQQITNQELLNFLSIHRSIERAIKNA